MTTSDMVLLIGSTIAILARLFCAWRGWF